MEGFLLLNVCLLQGGDVAKFPCPSGELLLKQIMKIL